MKIRRHSNIHTFLEETLDYLHQNESLNNLMLGICNRMKNAPDYYGDVYMATVKEDGNLILAAIMTAPQKLIVYSNINECDGAIDLLVKDLIDGDIYIPGIVGPKDLAKRTYEIWNRYVDCNVRLEMNMRVYELREVNKEIIGEGRLRLATEKDIDLTAKWMYEFEIDANLDYVLNQDECYDVIRRRIFEGSLYLWEYEGEVVSMAAKTRPTENGITIALVYTPKELRQRGYATSCVAALSQLLLNSGYKFCTLFTDLSNPISNSIYMKIGYKPVGDFDGYIIEMNE